MIGLDYLSFSRNMNKKINIIQPMLPEDSEVELFKSVQ